MNRRTLFGFLAAMFAGPTACLTRPSIDPRDYGAVGDGVEDDTQAVQRCLDRGGRIWVASGVNFSVSKLRG